MPTHRIPRARLEEDLIELLRRDNERVDRISYDGDFADVTTVFITLETRVVS